jgi:hypothetical protein
VRQPSLRQHDSEVAQWPTGFEVGSLLLAEMFAEGKNEVDLISEDHQEPTIIGHFLPVSMSKTPPADRASRSE